MFCAPVELEANVASQTAAITISGRGRTRKACQRRPIVARTNRACKFYCALKPLSKRLAKLTQLVARTQTLLPKVARFHTLLASFIEQRIDLVLKLLLLILQIP